MRFRSWLLVPVLALACVTSPAPRETPPPAQPVAQDNTIRAPAPIRLTLIGTNDLHGWVASHKAVGADGQVLEQGGLPVFAGYLAAIRAENPGGTLLLDGGDIFQGTLASNLTEGAVVIDAMNHLGYQAVAMGNHEFDYGPVGPAPVALAPTDDPFGALKARLKQAKFPILAVNIYRSDTGERPDWLGNDGTRIFEVKGVKVGVFGLVTPTTPQTTNPVNVATLRFGSLVPEALNAARKLRERGAELVVAITHAGGKCARMDDPKDLSSCDQTNGEVFELLNGLPPGTLDAVVAGHTHAPMAHVVQGTPVIETSGLGRSFGLVELFVDPVSRKVLPEQTTLRSNIAICAEVDEATGACGLAAKELTSPKWVKATFLGRPVIPDPALVEMLAPALARVEQEQQRELGVTLTRTLGRNYEAESALGSFLADTLREMEKADVALLNSGGLRADLRAGELRYGDVYEVIPFDNTVALITVTGEELKRLLHAAYSGKRGVFQVSGLKIQLSRCPGQGRLRGYTLADGRPVQDGRTYRVVMPDFLARGGDGLGPVLSSLPPGRIDLGDRKPLNFREGLIAQWQSKKKPLEAPKLGRIVFVDDGSACNEGAMLDMHAHARTP